MMDSINKIALLMKAKSFVKELRSMTEEDAVMALIDACGVIADKVHNDAFDMSRAQVINYLAENKGNRELALEIAVLPILERK